VSTFCNYKKSEVKQKENLLMMPESSEEDWQSDLIGELVVRHGKIQCHWYTGTAAAADLVAVISCCDEASNDTSCCMKHICNKQCQTYSYTSLTALLPGLPMWAGTRKVKPIWILLKQDTVSGSGISWAICKSASRSRQTTTPAPHHSLFYRHPANSVKALKVFTTNRNSINAT